MVPGLPSPASPARGRPWLGLLVFAGAAVYLLPFWQRVGLDSDEAKVILGTLRLLNGERLYVDIFEFVPPGLYALVALALRLGDAGPQLYPLRVLVVLIGAVGVAGTWAVAARAVRRPWVALIPAGLALAFGLSAWCIASVHWVSTTFALLATWALLDVGRVRAPWRPWFLGGLATGAVLLVAQHKGLALGAVALVLAGLYIRHAVRAHDRPRGRLVGPEDAFAVGLVLVVGPICLALSARGQLLPMCEAVFGWVARGYGVANRVPYGYLAEALFHPSRWHVGGPAVGAPVGALARLMLVYGLPVCLFAVLGRGAARWAWQPRPDAWADLTVGLVGGAMWLTVWTRPDVLHLLTVAPWGFIAATLLLAPAPESRPSNRARMARRTVAAGAVAIAIAWGVGDHAEERRWRSLPLGPLGFERYPRDLAPAYGPEDSDIARTIAYVQTATVPGEPIFVYPYAPYVYYLADRPNPTRYNISFPGYQGAEAIGEIIDTLEQTRVPLVVLSPAADPTILQYAFPGYDLGTYQQSPLTQYIDTRYAETERFGLYRILERGTR